MNRIFSFKKQDNYFDTCRHLLKILKINHTKIGLTEQLTLHPDYPSLLSISDCLNEYGIKSYAVPRDKYGYEDFETPYITPIQFKNWTVPLLTVVTDSQADKIEYVNPQNKKIEWVTTKDIIQTESQHILLLDLSKIKDENNYKENRKREKRSFFLNLIPVLFVAVGIVLHSLQVLTQSDPIFSFLKLSYILTSLVGLSAGLLLMIQEISPDNILLKKVCGGNSNQRNCNAVLSSSQSSLFGISWSSWGLAFFSTFFLSSLLFPTDYNLLHFWSYLSLIAAPYIVFSIYYQRSIVKKWCPLCLVVQGILATNVLIAVYVLFAYKEYAIDLSSYNLYMTILLGAFLLFSSYSIPKLIKKSLKGSMYEKKWEQLRLEPEVFRTLLNKGKATNPKAEEIGFVIGNPNAIHEIITACNPFCPYCADQYTELLDIVTGNPMIKVRIIFTATGDDSDVKTQPVLHLAAIQREQGDNAALRALDDWYTSRKKDYQSFASRYPVVHRYTEDRDKVTAMYYWCKNMNVRATPTVYVDGRALPDSYTATDLSQFLSGETF